MAGRDEIPFLDRPLGREGFLLACIPVLLLLDFFSSLQLSKVTLVVVLGRAMGAVSAALWVLQRKRWRDIGYHHVAGALLTVNALVVFVSLKSCAVAALMPSLIVASILVSLPASTGLVDRVERKGWWALILKIVVPLIALILGLRIVARTFQSVAFCG